MSLTKAVENLKYDKRLLDLNLRLGKITEQEFQQHVKALEDLEKNCDKVDLDESSKNTN
jgi:hypothetical protein